MTTTLIAFVMIGLAFLIFYYKTRAPEASNMFKQGIKGNKKPTMFDVRRLLVEGKEDSAVDVYMVIFKINRKDAKVAVAELKKHISNNHKTQ